MIEPLNPMVEYEERIARYLSLNDIYGVYLVMNNHDLSMLDLDTSIQERFDNLIKDHGDHLDYTLFARDIKGVDSDRMIYYAIESKKVDLYQLHQMTSLMRVNNVPVNPSIIAAVADAIIKNGDKQDLIGLLEDKYFKAHHKDIRMASIGMAMDCK